MGNKGRGEKTKMNKGRREGQGERANNNKEFSYVFVWCLFRSLIGPKSGQNPKKKKHPNLQPHLLFFVVFCGCGCWCWCCYCWEAKCLRLFDFALLLEEEMRHLYVIYLKLMILKSFLIVVGKILLICNCLKI